MNQRDNKRTSREANIPFDRTAGPRLLAAAAWVEEVLGFKESPGA